MENKTLLTLKAIAKKHNIKCYSKMCKSELVEILHDMGDEEPIEVNKYKCQHGKKKYYCKEC